MEGSHPLAYSVPEAARLCGISRAFLYSEIKKGRGPKLTKIGRRSLISHEALIAWLAELEVRHAA